ncbi:ArsR/SmtB family transcription factor [Sphingomonas hengshuiensis]|uniref:ArsR family transcriptional regulator n=1 Tax=Sphingomonas hengshuiensis TaxID=1609977 RepID=A0A7U4LEP2_9SPHN|nr:metalloregulator ArsR/SmtB family transcription factor [Sphingomonas hengshuiensis]AJP71694.1 ArsR family transcriptional regulator [Sphingomonas hengshuiensis]
MSNPTSPTDAVGALSALAHEQRLAVFRLLVKAGPEGLSAGAIAEALQSAPSSLSFHLAHLHRAGLVSQRRESRSLIYTASYDSLVGLIGFLLEDCCGGRPELCEPLTDLIRQATCCPAPVQSARA